MAEVMLASDGYYHLPISFIAGPASSGVGTTSSFTCRCACTVMVVCVWSVRDESTESCLLSQKGPIPLSIYSTDVPFFQPLLVFYTMFLKRALVLRPTSSTSASSSPRSIAVSNSVHLSFSLTKIILSHHASNATKNMKMLHTAIPFT